MFDMIPAPTRVFVRKAMLEAELAVGDVIDLLSNEVAELLGVPEAAGQISMSARLREREESTFVGQGLAVPHARLSHLEHAVVYVARSAEGLPWPEQKAHVISLLVVPETQPELHLQLLSRIVRARRSGRL